MLTHEFNDRRMKSSDKYVALYDIKATTRNVSIHQLGIV